MPTIDELFSAAIQEAYASKVDDVILQTIELQVPQSISGDISVLRMVSDYGSLIDPSLIPDWAEQMQKDSDQDIYGWMLKLESDATANPNETVLFVACMFDFILPEQKDGPLPNMTISFDNSSRLLAPYLDQIVALMQPVKVVYREYLASDPNTVQFKFGRMSIRQVKSDDKVEGTAEFANVLYKNFPQLTYLSKQFPGLQR